ncbi:MAG TPA: LysR substrate-binding domain-containing protein [Candidatus Limnocylindrales bacterium]|nr:LysR substrate-binding domain-containing protein [Candidatus Limnocylindrales bacterium]
MAARKPTPVPLPTLRQLEYVVAIADEASFGAAAAHCHVSQPGLSAQVREVERLLGVRIFERDRRGVIVTPAGVEIVERARALVATAREMVELARRRARPLCGPLRLGVIPTIAPYLLPAVLPHVRAEFPELRLMLREEKTEVLLGLIGKGRIDCALIALDVPMAGIESAPMFDDAFLLAVPKGHALARKKQVEESDLDGERVLLLEDGHCLRDQALAVCARAGADEDADFRATSLATLVQMVAGGDGVTLLPSIAVPVAESSGVIVRQFRAPPPSRRIGLVWRAGSSRGEEMRTLAASMAAAYAAAGEGGGGATARTHKRR